MARWLGWRGRCGHPSARDQQQLQKKLDFGPRLTLSCIHPHLDTSTSGPPLPSYPYHPIIFGRIRAPAAAAP